MSPDQIYFTWPDARFTYECAPCGACCKGLGIGLDDTSGQTQALVARYPAITPFLRKRGAAWTVFNPRGGCWFFADDGLCQVEVDHGRAAKPGACRLFPFNRIFRIGSYTIVDYNSVICPLQATAHDSDASGITHASVLADIEGIRDPALIGTQLPVKRPEEQGKRLLIRERQIAEICFQEADRDTPTLHAPWRAQAREGALDQTIERMSRALTLLTGQAFATPDAPTIRTAAWLTPSMRFNQLFGPRAYDPRSDLLSILPEMWLTWLHFLALGSTLSQRPLDMRQATTIWSEQIPLAYLAARWDRAPTLEPGEFEFPGEDDPDGMVKSFAQACIDNRSKRAPLSRLLSPLLEPYDPADRVVLARMLEPFFSPIRWRKRR